MSERNSKKSDPDSSETTSGNVQDQEASALDANDGTADAEVSKVVKDLEDLRQTLLRRQAS